MSCKVYGEKLYEAQMFHMKFAEFKKECWRRVSLALLLLASNIAVTAAAKGVLFLGPLNPGAENGTNHWRHLSSGVGFESIEHDDPASGSNYFRVRNTTIDRESSAWWLSDPFALGPAQDEESSITLSFAYKLPDEVQPNDNICVYFRFYGSNANDHLGEKMILVGANTGDSKMTKYKTLTRKNIIAPPGARMADIIFTANVNRNWHWGSGIAQFDDVSVTAESPYLSRGTLRTVILTFMGLSLLVPIGMIWTMWSHRRSEHKT